MESLGRRNTRRGRQEGSVHISFGYIERSPVPSLLIRPTFEKAQGRPYRLDRGDKELVVLPVALIPELNRLGADVLDSRQSHAFAFLSHLTGLQRTIKASYQTRILQRRVTPAVPALFLPMADQISSSIKQHLPAAEIWENITPLPAVTTCFGEAMCLVLFGAEMCKSPRLVHLASTLAEDGTFSFRL